jgi:hypothetical protein
MLLNSLEIGGNIGLGDLESPALRSEIMDYASLCEEA